MTFQELVNAFAEGGNVAGGTNADPREAAAEALDAALAAIFSPQPRQWANELVDDVAARKDAVTLPGGERVKGEEIENILLVFDDERAAFTFLLRTQDRTIPFQTKEAPAAIKAITALAIFAARSRVA